MSLALAVVGVFVPVLPTTPFLLLAAWLWLRSSRKLHDWLMGHRRLGRYIKDYQENRAVPVRVKAFALFFLWASMLFCIFCVLAGRTWLQVVLLGIALAVTLHILLLKSSK